MVVNDGKTLRPFPTVSHSESAGIFGSIEGGLNYRPSAASYQAGPADVEEEDSGLTAAVDRLHRELVRIIFFPSSTNKIKFRHIFSIPCTYLCVCPPMTRLRLFETIFPTTFYLGAGIQTHVSQ